MDSNSLLLNTLLNLSAIIMINFKSVKIKIQRIKGKVHSLTSKIYYKLQKSWEEKTRKVKSYNYFFLG